MKYGNSNIKHNDMITGCLYALGYETLYGLSYMFTKQATEMASEFMLLSWRFIISVVIMKVLIICGIMKIDIRKKNIKPIMMVALFSPCIYFIAETVVNGNVSQFITLPFREKSFLIAVLYQGIGCSVAAFFLSNEAISKIGVNRTSSFIGVATVVSIVAGAVFLKEKFTVYQFIGAIIIILGVYISNFRYRTD